MPRVAGTQTRTFTYNSDKFLHHHQSRERNLETYTCSPRTKR